MEDRSNRRIKASCARRISMEGRPKRKNKAPFS